MGIFVVPYAQETAVFSRFVVAGPVLESDHPATRERREGGRDRRPCPSGRDGRQVAALLAGRAPPHGGRDPRGDDRTAKTGRRAWRAFPDVGRRSKSTRLNSSH